MNQISKVVLKNFQCHKSLTINFDTDMTCLMGLNNGGKSASIRALYWILTNSPRGEWMRREADGVVLTAEAHITFTDGVTLGRIKGDKVNQYLMDGEVWEKFGVHIPSKIQDYIEDIELTKGSRILPNIHMQDDPAFMVFESSSVRGALVNYLTGIDVGDRMKKGFNKTLKDIKLQTSTLEGALEACIEKISEIGNTKKHLKQVEELEEVVYKLKDTKELLEASINLSDQFNVADNKLSGCVVFDTEKLNELHKVQKQYNKSFKDLSEATELASELTRSKKHLTFCKIKVDLTETLEHLHEMVEPIEKLNGELESLTELRQQRKELKGKVNNITKEHESVQEEIEKLEIEACPTCGQIIGSEHNE